MEPTDLVGMALIESAGAVDALRIATGAIKPSTKTKQDIAEILNMEGASPVRASLPEALKRWSPRAADLAPARDISTIERLGGRFLIPEDDEWPDALLDLGLRQPICLWARGGGGLTVPAEERSVALVGSRDSTNYGNSVTGDLAAGLAHRGMSVVSGGAYGIDSQAHRAALTVAGRSDELPTIAVSACGLDRYYPSGNEDLLRAISHQGMLLAEVPPGSSPTRWRFLQRNRLIAALCSVTVVVEARWRSGALNTAHHAADLSRQVAAVPGSVHSANSAGCHRLLREGSAICVTDAGEIAELAGSMGQQLPSEPKGKTADHDGLNLEDLLLLDALPVRAAAQSEKLASVAGLGHDAVLAGLGRLQLAGLAESAGGAWRRIKRAG
ncbi:DNA-processing protein DprA [Arthrobacter castelli]|uniref:DNA-processing protein DprA n=1 Tax=Arthrobacter castelli TaxID=271431 RepID=UPI001FE0F585|nr:DNA-processing protein DprA [Arthrobacter castelli]